MNEYVFTSKLFVGRIIFGYDTDGTLIKFIKEAELSITQNNWLHDRLEKPSRNFPHFEQDLHTTVGKSGKVELLIDVSFAAFWAVYSKKVNKLRAEKIWNRLSEADRHICLSKIKQYKNYCKTNNRILKDPDTYLNNRSWEDEL